MMDNKKYCLPIRAISAFALVALLAFPYVAKAVSIGEVVLQSKLGEPLSAQVDLVLGSGERIETSCLSLVPPDSGDDDAYGYITRAYLSIKTDGKRQYVAIRSSKSLNDVFARLRLQIKCPGMGVVTKTLTILPDLDNFAPQEQASSTSGSVETESKPVPQAASTREASITANPDDNRRIHHAANKYPSEKPQHRSHRPHLSKTESSPSTAKKPGHSSTFKLKLSGDPIDESRIGKISPEERTLLLAKQKLIDADDQTAEFLAMQHQVKLLQDELSQIKAQLAQLGINPNLPVKPVAVASAPSATVLVAASSISVPPVVAQSKPKPAVSAMKQPAAQQDDADQDRLIIALVLVVIIIALWMGLRYYTKIKSRVGTRSPQYNEPLLKETLTPYNAPSAPKMAGVAASKLPVQAQPLQSRSIPVTPPVGLQTNTSTLKSELAPPAPPSAPPVEEEMSEEDSMLEEAGLYATHGRPAKAAEILLEVIKQRPTKAEAWPLLFSIYSSLGKTKEFEKSANEFLIYHKDSPSWRGIQALGRTLDQNNPLYQDSDSGISAAPLLPDKAGSRRPVGDVLLEMGVLSKQDLQNCLDDFDPKKHGRFGGYLVARKVITLAQLDQALLQQQGIHNEVKAGALPSLQEMENFLADFDPKRDGSVGEFLASRNAVTPVQLSQLLQRQPAQATTTDTNQPVNQASPSEKPAEDKSIALNFEFDKKSSAPLPDLEFESVTTKSQPLEEKVETSPPTALEFSLDFPEINFDLVNDNSQGKKPGKK